MSVIKRKLEQLEKLEPLMVGVRFGDLVCIAAKSDVGRSKIASNSIREVEVMTPDQELELATFTK